MPSRGLILIALALWTMAFGWSVLQLWVTEPTGSGFTRGLNRISALFLWQIVAALLALGIWFAGRGRADVNRWLTRAPLLLATLLPLGILAIVLFSLLNAQFREAPVSPDRPVTAPAADAVPVKPD